MIFQISKIFGNNLIPPYFRIFGSKIGYRVREKVAGFRADFFENFLVTEGGRNMLNRPPGVAASCFARTAKNGRRRTNTHRATQSAQNSA